MGVLLTLASEMKLYRESKKFTITEFANRLSVSQPTVSGFESGSRPIPKIAIEKYSALVDFSSNSSNRLRIEEILSTLLEIGENSNMLCVVIFKELRKVLEKFLEASPFGENPEIWYVNFNDNDLFEKYQNLSDFLPKIYDLDLYKFLLYRILRENSSSWEISTFDSEKITEISPWPISNLLNFKAESIKDINIYNKIQLFDLYFILFKSVRMYTVEAYDIELTSHFDNTYSFLSEEIDIYSR